MGHVLVEPLRRWGMTRAFVATAHSGQECLSKVTRSPPWHYRLAGRRTEFLWRRNRPERKSAVEMPFGGLRRSGCGPGARHRASAHGDGACTAACTTSENDDAHLLQIVAVLASLSARDRARLVQILLQSTADNSSADTDINNTEGAES